MVACPVCATEVQEGFRFCPACGAALGDGPPAAPPPVPAAAPAGERKAVTALFCDLVGFTSLSESADPEDTDRMLSAYFALARREIERHGGTVEKFIGDAVVGIFGAPATHEDDPERAVRAALRICRDAAALSTAAGEPLRLRVGVNTGETLVHTAATPEKGEALVVGDAINTAARIQSVAPEMGVAVGLSTWESTHLAIDYAEVPPATLKGKSEPVRVFEARAVRASLGVDLSRSHAGGYVGREAEINKLQDAFAAATAEGRARFVAVVGEPGIGKSRILAELATRIHADRADVAWRQGRCLPYGDGVTFWALGEILKAHAGILEGDDPADAAARIDDILPDGTNRDWLRERLLPLVGAGTVGGEREEQFGAWREFLAGIATEQPAVVVFEDVHWADEALVAFLAFLAADAPPAPLLVLLTSRPTGRAASLPGIDRLDLQPLTDDETEQLIAGILGAVVPHELHQPILDRAEGNPLYAEEFVRLLVDRDLLVRSNGTYRLRDGATIPTPDSITSLLGARLDMLPPSRKALLADASVVGKVFWSGAVAALAGRTREDVEADLAELAKVDLVRPAPRSSMAGESEFAFWHVLARDVAYQQLPRASRAARHEAVGDWLEGRAGSRVDDLAQVLAHHYATALDLARAAGDTERAAAIKPCALRYLRLAGERAIGLDAPAAVSFLERALVLAPDDHVERPELLAAFAEAADQIARHEEARDALEEAIDVFEARGDTRAAARAILRLQLVYFGLRDPRQDGFALRAIDYLTTLGPCEDLVLALTQQGVEVMNAGDVRAGLHSFDRAIEVSQEIGMTPPGRTLRRRGHARLTLGDPGAFEDYERGIESARAAGDTREASIGSLWYAGVLTLINGYGPAKAVLADGLEYANARGLSSMVQTLTAAVATFSVDDGSFDEATAIAHETLPAARASQANSIVLECLYALLCIHAMRGETAELPGLIDEINAINPTYGFDELWIDFLVALAEAHLAMGDRDGARSAIDRMVAQPELKITGFRYLVGRAVRVATELEDPRATWMLEDLQTETPGEVAARRWAEASIAESRGDHAAAADAYAEAAEINGRLGMRTWEAITRLGLGRSLAALGRANEASVALGDARALFEELGASPWVVACDAFLAEAASVQP